MSDDMENSDKQDLIERYLDGTLSAAQHEAFESLMQAEPDFRAEVMLHRQLQEELGDPQKLSLRKTLSKILEDEARVPKK